MQAGHEVRVEQCPEHRHAKRAPELAGRVEHTGAQPGLPGADVVHERGGQRRDRQSGSDPNGEEEELDHYDRRPAAEGEAPEQAGGEDEQTSHERQARPVPLHEPAREQVTPATTAVIGTNISPVTVGE